MLQTIRDHTQGWIAGTIISIIILTFAMWGIHSYFEGGGRQNIVAEVNGIEITKEQLTLAYERLRKQLEQQFGTTPPPHLNDHTLKQQALRGLIDIEVLKQAALDQGFRISDRQIDNYLQSIPEFQVNGEFSPERFQEVLANAYLSTSEFLELVKTSLLIEQPKEGIVLSSFALPFETRYIIDLVNQDRNFDYINIPTQKFISNLNISDADIKNYYANHQQEFLLPEQMSVEYLELNYKMVASSINPSDEQLKNFYQENSNSFAAPREWKLTNFIVPVTSNASQDDINKAKDSADQAVSAIQNGMDFNTIAKKYLQTMDGSEWVRMDQLSQEARNAVLALTSANQVSNPIKTDQGYLVLKAVEVKEPRVLTFEEARDKVKHAYIKQQADEKFAELRDQLSDLVYEHPDSLVAASEKLHLPVKTSQTFTKEKVGSDISQHKKVRQAAFSHDVMNLQNNSEVLQLNPETAIVLRAKAHTPAKLLPLNEVTTQIQQKLRLKTSETQAETLAQNLVKKLQGNEDVNLLLKENQLTWNQAGFLGRYANKVHTAILDVTFRLPNPAVVKKPATYGVAKIPEGYAVIALKEIKPGEPTSQDTVFAEQVQNSDGMLEYELYKASQLDRAKVKMVK